VHVGLPITSSGSQGKSGPKNTPYSANVADTAEVKFAQPCHPNDCKPSDRSAGAREEEGTWRW